MKQRLKGRLEQRYSVLETEGEDVGKARMQTPSDGDEYIPYKSEVPWKSLLLSFGLLVAGVVFWSLSVLHMLGHFFSKDGAGWGFFVLGFLTFTPGFYHSWIAICAWRGVEGYSLSSIPRL